MQDEQTIEVSFYDIKIGPNGIQLYKGKPVIDTEELPDGRFVMRYCNENEIPLSDSPKIICGKPIIE